MQILATIPLLALALSVSAENAGTTDAAAEIAAVAIEANGVATKEDAAVSAVAEATADARVARLSLADGSTLFASIQTQSFLLETLFGAVDITVATITGAEFARTAEPRLPDDLAKRAAAATATSLEIRARLALSDGSIIHGKIAADSLSVKAIFGCVEIPIEAIRKLNFKPAPQTQKNNPPAANDPRLIYWNTFDSNEAATTPAAGVPTQLYGGAFVAGKSGMALHTQGQTDVSAFSIPPGAFKEQGCIEFWAKLDTDTDRMEDGRLPRFLLGAKDDRWSSLKLEYSINNGMGAGGFTASTGCIYGTSHFGQTYSYQQVLGDDYAGWHHYAFVWDDAQALDIPGFEGRTFAAIFIDGVFNSIQTHPANMPRKSNMGGFGDTVGNFVIAGSRDAGGNTHPIPFAIDELKIWNYAKMDFAENY